MKKQLLTIEFRYDSVPKYKKFGGYTTKIVTIGIFDTLNDAINSGNDCLKVLSNRFEVRKDDIFSLTTSLGIPGTMVTNCCYPTNGVQYFAKITSLNFDNLEDKINEIFEMDIK